MSELGRLRVEDVRVAATPGQQTAAIVTVHNHGDSAANAVVRTVGLGDGWASPPSAIGPIAPGEAVETELIIQVPAGFPPCEHLGAVEVESVDVATGAPLGDASSADLVIVIGDASLIQATLEPADLVGSGKSRFQLVLGNRVLASRCTCDSKATRHRSNSPFTSTARKRSFRPDRRCACKDASRARDGCWVRGSVSRSTCASRGAPHP